MSISNRKNFIPRNEAFVCEQCGTDVPPAKGTFRNHCPQCLTSKHVDIVPGDRAAACGGPMPAVGYEGTDPDKLDILHHCKSCGHRQRNRRASDDNIAILFSSRTP